jgi:iron complex transport system ATP-binding protein
MLPPKFILHADQLELGYRKGNSIQPVASNISFGLEKGKLTCLLGPNGVGKSTLVKTIMGQIPALSGELWLGQELLTHLSLSLIAKKIAVVLTDKIQSANLTVRQLVELGRIPHTGWMGRLSVTDEQKIEKAISGTNINYLQHQKLSEISDGQLQKVMVARALAQDGEIIILDEPTAHLDLINRYELMQLLRQIALTEDKAILVVTHDLDIAIATADVFWLMQCGQPLIQGMPESLIISGKINALLPNSRLEFDRKSGKVKPAVSNSKPEVTGPFELVQWVQLALDKRNLKGGKGEVSVLSNDPPLFHFKEKDVDHVFDDLEKLVNFLENLRH